MSFDEVQDALPGVGRGFGVLLGTTIKEAVWGAGIDNDLVFNTRSAQLLIEALHVADRDALIGATKEAKCGIVNPSRLFEQCTSTTKVSSHASIEADHARQIKFAGAGHK